MQGAKGHFVWVIKDGKADFRTVDMGNWYRDEWFVNQGLKAGEVIVVDGAVKLADDMPVKIASAKAPASKK